MTAPPLHTDAMTAAQQRWATRAKPPGSLGKLEALATHVAGVTGVCPPPTIVAPALAVFAADHGVVDDGASAWPSEITQLMAQTISDGAAACSALARTAGASVLVVDVGIRTTAATPAGVRHERVRSGTYSIARGPAMTVDDATAAMDVGKRIVRELITDGADLLVAGDMGIGNTTPSAALICSITGADPADAVGLGAGAPPAGLDHKIALVRAACERTRNTTDALQLLAEVGGLEIAALAGFYVEAANQEIPFIADGVISLAALSTADLINPGTSRRAIAGHRSTEPAATIALDHLDLEPVLDLDLRLGEGTGALLAIPIVHAAVEALNTMTPIPAP